MTAPAMDHTVPTLPSVMGKRVVLISHDLSQTGSPLLLVETASQLQRSGAQVELVTLADDTNRSNLAAQNHIQVTPVADSFEKSAEADLVIANTAETAVWVDNYLNTHPGADRSLIWWIHEIDAEFYAAQMQSLRAVPISIFDSHASLQSWQQSDVILPSRTRVLYPGVDRTLMDQAVEYRATDTRLAIRNKLGVDANDFVVTMVGTYHSQKGQDLFVNTISSLMKEHPYLPLKAIVVGFGKEEARQNFLNGLDDGGRKALSPERTIGVVQDLAPYYAASDAFVMNSQGLGENFGRVTTEAMTFSLPVLGTNAGGTPEIVDNGTTGLLHAVGVAGQKQLGENILALMKDRKHAAAMGEAGLRRVQEKFTGPRFYSELNSILEEVLQGTALST